MYSCIFRLESPDQHSCVYCCLFHIPILIQQIPKFKQGANIFGPLNQRVLITLEPGFVHCVLVWTWESYQLDTVMSTEGILKVIAYSKKRRDVTHDNAMHFKREITDFEGKLDLTNGERVIRDHITSKLQIYDSEFH